MEVAAIWSLPGKALGDHLLKMGQRPVMEERSTQS